MKPLDVKSNTYINSSEKSNNKDLKFKIDYNVRIPKIKIFLQKLIFLIGLKSFLWLKKLKTMSRGDMLLLILMERKLLERFTKKYCKNQLKIILELQKW